MNKISPTSHVVAADDAKTHLAQLLDRVEDGEEITITRHGRSVARLIPAAPSHDSNAARHAVDALHELRQRLASRGVRPFSLAEIVSLRDEGRR